MNSKLRLIELGKVVKPHGYSGAFVASAVSGQKSSLGLLKEIHIGFDRSSLTPYEITEAAWMPKGWKVQVRGLQSEEAVRSLVGATLFADRSALPEPEEGEFYVEDLIGAEVIDSQTNQSIGRFQGVQSGTAGSADLWWVETPEGPLSIPAVKRYIESVNLEPPVIRLRNLKELDPIK